MESKEYSPLQLTTFEAGLLQARAYRKLNSFLSDALSEYELSLPKWAFLGLVCENEAIRLRTLAGLLEVEPPFATRLARELTAAGLIELTQDPKDGRAKQVRVTSAGQERAARVEKALRANLQQYLKGIRLADLATYVKVLRHLSELPDRSKR